jgi:hypothetical protein
MVRSDKQQITALSSGVAGARTSEEKKHERPNGFFAVRPFRHVNPLAAARNSNTKDESA